MNPNARSNRRKTKSTATVISAGDTVYIIDGQYIHEDCLEDFARGYFADCLTEARV